MRPPRPAPGRRSPVQLTSGINVTPLVDVMLVLLIIFMVAAPLATVAIKVDAPPAATRPPQTDPPTVVTVQRSGALFIADKETRLATLAADLAAVIGGPDPTKERVFVRAEQDVRYDAFMAVVSRLKADGYDQLALVNEDTA